MNQMDALHLAAMEIAETYNELYFDERRVLESYGIFSMTEDEVQYLDALITKYIYG